MFNEQEENEDMVHSHIENLIQYEETIRNEFLESERIPKSDRFHSDKLLDGLFYIEKINPMHGTRYYGFEHDVMYIEADLGEFKEKDILHLYRLGFIIEEEDHGGFMYY